MSLSMIDTGLVDNWRASPNHEARPDGSHPDMLILHYTGMADHDRALYWLTTPESKVSCHYLVDEDGTVTQMVAERHKAWHAGISHWAGRESLNDCSIGIEIHNPGHEAGRPPYPEAQMEAVTRLALDICARRGIPAKRVLAHSDVAPNRKADPGEWFDWARLYRVGVGLWVPPMAVDATDRGIGPGDTGVAVTALQRAFGDFGYGVPASGEFCAMTEHVVRAFQRHWRPMRVDGRADQSTLATLARLAQLREAMDAIT
ncbi:MAG: N-acetylmuramoyl-L-alanine amidase [Rhizobiales bacterium]|nr:N-acetylmuramoyl-L-alanine amidase [Hyphomicrobiales bacterium]